MDYETLLKDLKFLCKSDIYSDSFVSSNGLDRCFDEVIEAFPAEYEQANNLSPFLLGGNTEMYSEKTAAFFLRWDETASWPRLPSLCAVALDHFEFDPGSSEARIVMMAACLGEIPNALPYHGNAHYRKVLFHTIRLISTHNTLHQNDEKRLLSRDQILALLAAAPIHDLGHDGGNNTREGVYRAGYLEQRSFDMALLYLKAAGLEGAVENLIDLLIYTTDISAGQDSPCLQLKAFYQDSSGTMLGPLIAGRMAACGGDMNTAETALILHEADIATSAGLTYAQTIRETLAITAERGLESAGPETVLSFLQKQIGGAFLTPAGQHVFGAALERIMNDVAEDLKNGRTAF